MNPVQRKTVMDEMRRLNEEAQLAKNFCEMDYLKKFNQLAKHAIDLVMDEDTRVHPEYFNVNPQAGEIEVCLTAVDIIIKRNTADKCISLYIGCDSDITELKLVEDDVYSLDALTLNESVSRSVIDICHELSENLSVNNIPDEYLDPDSISEFVLQILTIK